MAWLQLDLGKARRCQKSVYYILEKICGSWVLDMLICQKKKRNQVAPHNVLQHFDLKKVMETLSNN